MKVNHALAAAALAAAALSLAPPAAAQFGGMGAGMGPGMGAATAPGMGYGFGRGSGPGPFGAGTALHGFDMQAMADAQLAVLHDRLGITASQQPLWDAFAAAVREQTADMEALRTRPADPAATAAARMTLHAQLMRQFADGAAAVAAAFAPLYESLNAEQRAIADRLSAFGPGAHMGPFGR